LEKINYQRILENELKQLSKLEKTPKLLLHSCCAPCSSYVLEYLTNFFDISILFYNPNIHPETEYQQRLDELNEFINKFPLKNKISVINTEYDTSEFYNAVRGLEDCQEGKERCFECYKLRLQKTAEYAEVNNFDYFTTALSISPHKNAQYINSIGRELSLSLSKTKFLFADFKKKSGFKRSTEISKEYNLYRQDYCGCIFSKNSYK